MIKAVLMSNEPSKIHQVYGDGRKDRIAERTELYNEVITPENFILHSDFLRKVDVIFSTWHLWDFSDNQLFSMPELKVIFYAAGSVKRFASKVLSRGIRVVSAASANGVSVAMFALAQIILAGKGYFRNIRDSSIPQLRLAKHCFTGPGNFELKVGLIGAGNVARHLIRFLKQFNFIVFVYDPYLSADEARNLGIEKRDNLEDIFKECFVVSNHAPDIPMTRDMITGDMIRLLQPGAVFINTGRGATVREKEMIEVLKQRKDLTALLDVTYPEPPLENSPLYKMENVYMTSHIAGAIGKEVLMMANFVIEQFDKWCKGEKMEGEVTLDILPRLG